MKTKKNKSSSEIIWLNSTSYPNENIWNPDDKDKFNQWCKEHNVSTSHSYQKKYEGDNSEKMMNEMNIDDRWVTTYIRYIKNKK